MNVTTRRVRGRSNVYNSLTSVDDAKPHGQ